MSTHLTTLAHESTLGRWQVVYRMPAPELRPFVALYSGYCEFERRFGAHLQTASSLIPLILNLGPPYRIDGPLARGARHESFIAGLHDAPTLVASDGPQHSLQIDLTPPGARRLLGLPMAELANRVVALGDILGAETAELLIERLAATPGWEARFVILDTMLQTRLASAPEIPPGVLLAWNRLQQTAGNIAIRELAGELGWSNKHLIARFREHIGVPPKTVARILRFERAAGLLRDGDACLATVAHRAGYYDQAHLHRDLRQFAGMTPAAFLRRRVENMDGLVGDDLNR